MKNFMFKSLNKAISTPAAIILIVILAGLIIGTVLAYQYWWTPEEEYKEETRKLETRTTPEEIVSQFYQGYLEAANCGPRRGCASEMKEYVKLNDDLEKNYKEWLLKEEVRLADPVLWASDVPPEDNLQVSNAIIKDNTASVYVTFLPIWPNHKLRVSLSLVDNEWRISNVEDVSSEKKDKITSFEECVAKRNEIGELDSKTTSMCECDLPDGRIFVKEIENIEGLITKYTDEDFGFSFYYPKSFELFEEKHPYFEKADLYLRVIGRPFDFEDEDILIIKHSGDRVEDWDAKFGGVVFYYNKDKDRWMECLQNVQSDCSDYDERYFFPMEPDFYTISGLPGCFGRGRWRTEIVFLSSDKVLVINMRGSGWTKILDPLTKTVIRTDQEVNDEELKNLLKEEICSLER